MAAAALALEDAGVSADRGAVTGVVASSNLGNLDTVCAVTDTIATAGSVATSPMDLPNASSNVVASSIAIRFGLRGPNLMLCNGGTSGLDAVYWAGLLVAAGRAARCVVVGVETDNAVVRALTGAGMGDGAVALVLEAAGAARARGAAARAGVGRYARRGDLRACLAALAAGQVALWLVGGHATDPRPAGFAAARIKDLTGIAGPASGALGVLQCVVAAGWLAGGRAGATGDGIAVATADGVAAATAGGVAVATADGEDASAALALSTVDIATTFEGRP
jgi:3-oxoacyl-[acyl-carrier-protein] synthase II